MLSPFVCTNGCIIMIWYTGLGHQYAKSVAQHLTSLSTPCTFKFVITLSRYLHKLISPHKMHILDSIVHVHYHMHNNILLSLCCLGLSWSAFTYLERLRRLTESWSCLRPGTWSVIQEGCWTILVSEQASPVFSLVTIIIIFLGGGGARRGI